MDIKDVQAKYPIGSRIDLTTDCKITLNALWVAADSISYLHEKCVEEVNPSLDEAGDNEEACKEIMESFLLIESMENPFKTLVSLRMGGFGNNAPISLHGHNKSMIGHLCWLLAFKSLSSNGFDMTIQEYMVLRMEFDRANFQVIVTGYQFDVESINKSEGRATQETISPDEQDISDFLGNLPPIDDGENDE